MFLSLPQSYLFLNVNRSIKFFWKHMNSFEFFYATTHVYDNTNSNIFSIKFKCFIVTTIIASVYDAERGNMEFRVSKGWLRVKYEIFIENKNKWKLKTWQSSQENINSILVWKWNFFISTQHFILIEGFKFIKYKTQD